jgi:hypothetical protein
MPKLNSLRMCPYVSEARSLDVAKAAVSKGLLRQAGLCSLQQDVWPEILMNGGHRLGQRKTRIRFTPFRMRLARQAEHLIELQLVMIGRIRRAPWKPHIAKEATSRAQICHVQR